MDHVKTISPISHNISAGAAYGDYNIEVGLEVGEDGSGSYSGKSYMLWGVDAMANKNQKIGAEFIIRKGHGPNLDYTLHTKLEIPYLDPIQVGGTLLINPHDRSTFALNWANGYGQNYTLDLNYKAVNHKYDVNALLRMNDLLYKADIALQNDDTKKVQIDLVANKHYYLNVNATNNQGMTSLHKAVQKRHIDIVELLLENGANIFAKTKAKNSNCLLLASQKGHVEMMKLLIEKGLDINSRDIDGSTPFLITCLYGQAKAAQFLLRNGANIEDVNKHSYNGLYTTAFLDGKYANLREITKLLLTNGADVTVKKKEMSAFHLAVKRRNFHFIKALFDHRPTFDIKDSRNENVIEHVLRRNKHDAIKMISYHFHQL